MLSLPQRVWDVAVIGAGPAGSVCAYLLAEQGHSVVLVDKAEFPRPKPCGDFLIGDSLWALDKLGMREQVDKLAHHSPGFRVYYGGGRRIEFSGLFTTLTREVLDCFVWRQALAKGAQPSVGRAENLSTSNRGGLPSVQFDESAEVSARYAVVATGADSIFTRRALGLHRSSANAVAFRKYIESDVELAETTIVYHESILPGYGWIIPVEPKRSRYRYNVGAGWPLEGVHRSRHITEVVDTILADIPAAKALIDSAVSVSRWSGAPMKCGLTLENCLPAERVVAIGEAIGTTYPFTGEGIGKAMLSGMYAADAINDALRYDDPSRLVAYREAMGKLAPHFDSFAKVEKRLAGPWRSHFLLNRLRNSRYLRDIFNGVFHNDGSPAQLLKPLTLMRSYWK